MVELSWTAPRALGKADEAPRAPIVVPPIAAPPPAALTSSVLIALPIAPPAPPSPPIPLPPVGHASPGEAIPMPPIQPFRPPQLTWTPAVALPAGPAPKALRDARTAQVPTEPADSPTVEPVYDKTMLRLPEMVPSISQVWASEPRDFTPWLATHLEILDVLGLGRLELIEQEKAIPGVLRALDVLAARPTGELVAIENQFSKLDHDHLTRGLAYAVAVQATSLVLIAEDHQGEFRAVARYLNELAVRSEAPQQIGVYLVTVGVERLEEYLIPRVSVVESPNPLREEPKVSAAPRPYVAGLEEFLSRVTPQAVQGATELCRWWQSIGGTLRFSRQSVSLDREHPTKTSQVLSYLVLYTSGSCWLNRGYLTESGVVPRERVDEFDTLVASALPSLRRGENGYYLVAGSPISVEGLERIIGWIDQL